MPDSGIAALQAELAVLARRAQAPLAAADGEALRGLIADLERRVHQAEAALVAMRTPLRTLRERLHDAAADAVPSASVSPPPPIRADHLGASTYRDKGWSLISAGDQDGAVTALREALRLAPDDLEAEVMLGWALMLGDRLDEALASFGRVLAQQPDHALARVNLGYICLRRRIFGEAIEHLTRVLHDAGDRKATLYANYYLGLVYLDRGMFRDAVPFFRQALALGPNLHEASFDLGRALWFAGEADAARETWQGASAAGHRSPWATRCAEVLAIVDAGGEVPRSRPL